ncbi:hypothetical protein [Pseudomonas granadensis]|nr:hypothetical protein [Pseudomonas granadensis]
MMARHKRKEVSAFVAFLPDDSRPDTNQELKRLNHNAAMLHAWSWFGIE